MIFLIYMYILEGFLVVSQEQIIDTFACLHHSSGEQPLLLVITPLINLLLFFNT